MKTVARIVNAHGGIEALRAKYLRIENPPYMRLCVEYVGTGPRGLPMISVAHYFEQGGDAICDPDATFEVAPDSAGMLPEDGKLWGPVAIQHGTGKYVRACWEESGRVLVSPRQVADLRSFSRMWDRNIGSQGFPEAFSADRK